MGAHRPPLTNIGAFNYPSTKYVADSINQRRPGIVASFATEEGARLRKLGNMLCKHYKRSKIIKTMGDPITPLLVHVGR